MLVNAEIGNKVNTRSVQDFLRFVNQSEYEFFLTGSRFFGTARDSSDYDFFVESSVEIENELINQGFTQLSSDSYRDRSIARVFRLLCDDGSVDVQLLLPLYAEKKNVAQNVIAALIEAGFISMKAHTKKGLTKLWNTVLGSIE